MNNKAKFDSANPALIIIDVQEAIDCFSQSPRNNIDAEAKISGLLEHWRGENRPIVHVRHSSKFTESPYHSTSRHFDFKQQVKPIDGECIITKSENCAFINTHLEQHLKALKITELVICGVVTNHSVDATVRIASALGFRVFVPHDATAAFAMQTTTGKNITADDVHWVFLTNLDGEYCEVTNTAELLES